MISREAFARRCSICNPPITDPELEQLQIQFDHRLPETLIQILRVANGFDMEVGDGVVFYGSGELFSMNEAYANYCPQHILIAMTGGAECALISRNDGSIKHIGEPGSLLDEYLQPLSPSLEHWLESEEMFPTKPEPDISSVEPVYIYLEQMPADGLKDLMIIKKVIPGITSVLQMKKIAEQSPAALSKELSYVRACRIVRELGKLGDCLSVRLASDTTTRLPLD